MSADDKSEAPTGKRVAKARSEGRIAKSQELVSWVAILAGMSVMKSTTVKGGRFCEQLMGQMGDLIANPDQGLAIKFMTTSVAGAFKLVAPLALVFALIGIIGHLAQVRFVLAFKSIKPSFAKLNPMKGAKNLFSPSSLFQAAKQLVKLVVLSFVAYRTLWQSISTLSGNGPYSINTLITSTSGSVMEFIKQVAFVCVLIGIGDYFYQKKKMSKSMKMSKSEVKQESRQEDLAPEIRGKIRAKQREMSRNRMMSAINDADVVVVNPVHVAVALTYDAEKGAPKVVAKGAGFVAEKIRERAEENNVLIVQNVPLARTLHRICEIDDEIPGDLFEAVAQLLAFVFALKARGVGRNSMHKMPGTPDVAEYEAQQAREAAEAEASGAGEYSAAKRFGMKPQEITVKR